MVVIVHEARSSGATGPAATVMGTIASWPRSPALRTPHVPDGEGNPQARLNHQVRQLSRRDRRPHYFASRSSGGAYSRTWDIGVPEGGDSDGDGRNCSFVIDDTSLGTEPEFVVKYGSGNVGIGVTSPQARLHVNGTILSGQGNTLSGNFAAIGGGQNNFASGDFATIGGGKANGASFNAVVGGGSGNNAEGSNSTIPGGTDNYAGGAYSFAAGWGAQARHDGSFVWADAQPGGVIGPATFESTSPNQFSIRAIGGLSISAGDFARAGDARSRTYVLRGSYVTGNETIGYNHMFLGLDANGYDGIEIPRGAVVWFDVKVVAISPTGEGAGVQFDGAVAIPPNGLLNRSLRLSCGS